MSSSLFKDIEEQRTRKMREQERLAELGSALRRGDMIRLQQAELCLERVQQLQAELGLQQEIAL